MQVRVQRLDGRGVCYLLPAHQQAETAAQPAS
jgi:hypothetical protein